MKKHKLTPEMDDALKQFAERLPEPQYNKPEDNLRPKTGAEILAQNPEMRDAKGNPLDPDKKYFITNSYIQTNHLRRLRKAFKAGGKDAVVEYLRPYEEFLHTPETQPQS